MEAGAAVVDEVHLVDGHHDVANAQHVGDVSVALGLRQHTLAGVDQDNREIGRRGSGRHVARVLFVPGRVGHDELALVGSEEAVRYVDCDALLALGLEAVEQQREIDVLALRAVLDRVLLQGGQLVLEDQLGVVQQPADQR